MDPDYPIEIHPGEVADLIAGRENSVEVLDVRELWEREICALEGSRHIPMSEIPARVDELPRDRALVVYCHHGMRSLQVTMWLREQGLDNVVNLGGGIDAWARDVDPAMPTY